MNLITTFGKTLFEQGTIDSMAVDYNHITDPDATFLDRYLSAREGLTLKRHLFLNHVLFLASVHPRRLFPIVPCRRTL